MVCVLVSRYMEVIELMQEELVLRMDLFRRIEKALVFMKEKVMRSAIARVICHVLISAPHLVILIGRYFLVPSIRISLTPISREQAVMIQSPHGALHWA